MSENLPIFAATAKKLPLLAAAVLLGACTMGPDYQRPALDLPGAWRQDATAAQPVKSIDKWWAVYGDANVDALVAEALERNRDLAAAAARIEAARANLNIVDADRYPVVSAGLNRSRTRISSVASSPLPAGFPVTNNDTRVTLAASYEIDFWGKYRRASEAARAELIGTEAGRDAVLLSLTSDVVKAYYTLLSLRGQEEVAQRTLQGREQLVDLQGKRFKAGVASELELRQVEADRDGAQVQLIALKNQREAEDARLAVLLGRSPRDVWEKRIEQALTAPLLATPGPVLVPEGLPSDLLGRRPDLRQAEQQLIAANARIGVAKANYFPSISLTGYLGSESKSLANLFTGPAQIYQLAAGITAPIWNAGRVGAQVNQANAQQKEALANYEKSVQSAFADVRTALSALSAARETAETQSRRAETLSQGLKLARLRYDNGISSLLEVLDAERNLLAAELSRIDALAAQRSAVADLIKALGGGWTTA